MIGPILLLIVVGALVFGIVNAARGGNEVESHGAPSVVRRVAVLGLLGVVIVIAAIGVSGLLERLIGGDDLIAGSDTAALARSLAFGLIATPVAGSLWWYLWRRADSRERASVAWGVYLSAMRTLSLIVATVALSLMASQLIAGDWSAAAAAIGGVWSGVWFWHAWMAASDEDEPRPLGEAAPVLGATYGLVVGIGGAVTALGTLFGVVLNVIGDSSIAGDPWWRLPTQALVWAGVGAIVWWWHWYRLGAVGVPGVLGNAVVVALGIAGGAGLALGGIGTVLYAVLVSVFGVDATSGSSLEAVPPGLASALVGTVVWIYHRGVTSERSPGVRQAAQLVVSALGLISAASGVGVLVNATLAPMGTRLAGADGRALLYGGLTALAVGGVTWWLTWQPAHEPEADQAGSPQRIVYLVVVFSVSAIVALITLLTIGFRLFEALLEETSDSALIDRLRAPLGLLMAAGLVAGYHYPIWRRERMATRPAVGRRLQDIILITSSPSEQLRRELREATGATVMMWATAPVGGMPPTVDAITSALAEVMTGTQRIVVIVKDDGTVEIMPIVG